MPTAPALDLLRVGDQHLPAMRRQLIVDEPRAVHRLDHPPHRLPIHRNAARQPIQAIPVRRHEEMIAQLPLVGDKADVHAPATEIQANVQHMKRASFQAGSR